MHKLAHPDGEMAVSRVAAKWNICMALSSYATEPLENVAAVGTGNPYAMQICVLRDRGTTLQILKKAAGRTFAPNSCLRMSSHGDSRR